MRSEVANKGKRLRKMLCGWIVKDSSESVMIQYKVNGFQVCKSFFRLATGFTKNLFNSIVDAVLNPDSRPRLYHKPAREGILDAVAFLDVFFKQPGRSGKSIQLYCCLLLFIIVA